MGFQSAEQALESLQSRRRNLFHHAPHLIVLYYRIVEKSNVMIGLRANDAGIALTYGMLEAESLGLGTCWIGMIQGAVQMNKEILNILSPPFWLCIKNCHTSESWYPESCARA